MSESDRGERNQAGLIATALVGAICVVLYWSMFYDMGFQSGQNERKANVEAEHYASDTANQIDRECGAESGQSARECIAKIVAAERESQRGESDLAAQWKAANWVMWAGILAGAQLVATAFGLFYIRETLRATLKAVEDTGKATKAMERQNEIASDNAKRQLRAYVTFGEFVLNMDKADWKVQLKWNNGGQTPAIEVHTVADWIALETPLPADFTFPDPPPYEEDGPATIGPKQSVYGTCPQDLSPALLISAANGDRQVYAWGSVEYFDAFGQHRRTEIAAKVQIQSRPGGSPVMRWRTLNRHNGIDGGCMKPPCNANDDKRPRADG